MQRKTDEASVLQKRLHHLALESEGGRDKAQAYASSLTPGGPKPRTPGGYRTPGKGKKSNGMVTPTRQGGTPAGGTPRVSMTGGKPSQRHLVDVQVNGVVFHSQSQLPSIVVFHIRKALSIMCLDSLIYRYIAASSGRSLIILCQTG